VSGFSVELIKEKKYSKFTFEGDHQNTVFLVHPVMFDQFFSKMATFDGMRY
jgi:hypothetical protein